jgi:hypothetical protein
MHKMHSRNFNAPKIKNIEETQKQINELRKDSTNTKVKQRKLLFKKRDI